MKNQNYTSSRVTIFFSPIYVIVPHWNLTRSGYLAFYRVCHAITHPHPPNKLLRYVPCPEVIIPASTDFSQHKLTLCTWLGSERRRDEPT